MTVIAIARQHAASFEKVKSMSSHATPANESKFKSVFRVVSGNFLEMYDFMVYGYYASAIQDVFPER